MPSGSWIDDDRRTFASLCEGFAPVGVPGFAGVLPIHRWTADPSLGPSGDPAAPREYLVYTLAAPGQSTESTVAATPQVVPNLDGDRPERRYALRLWHFFELAPAIALDGFVAHLADQAPTGWSVLADTLRTGTDGPPEDNGMTVRAFEIDIAIDDRFAGATP